MTTDFKKILKWSAILGIILFIAIYSFFRSKDLIFGVKIKNVNITDGQSFNNPVIKINGNAKNAVLLSINDRPISMDQKGNFDETISLLSGYNIINIKARDAFGNNDEKTFRLMGEFAKETKL